MCSRIERPPLINMHLKGNLWGHSQVADLYSHLITSHHAFYREKMATAGSKHVRESCGEVNDGLAVVPEAEMEIGRTQIYVVTTLALMDAHMQRWMSGEWVMRVTVSVSDKPEQSGKTRSCCVITNWQMNLCSPTSLLLLVCWWVCLVVFDKTPPPSLVFP